MDELPPNEPLPEKKDYSKHRKPILLGAIFIFLLIALACFLYWLIWLRFEESTDDAYVDGNMVTLTPQISGIVTSINADDTDYVKKNQCIIQLDPTDSSIAFQQNKANLAENLRNVVKMFEKVKELQAEIEVKKADLYIAQVDFENRRNLVDAGGVSKEDYAHSEAHFHAAFADLQRVEHQLTSAIAQIDGTSVTTHPLVEMAKDQLRESWVKLQRCQIRTPVSGLIAQRTIQLGEWVNPAQPLLAIIPPDQMWITANFKEIQLAKMKIGQPVKMRADIYGDDVVYHGTIIGIGGGTGSVFSVLPPQNATGNWIKIVQRVPVRICLNPDELKKHPLRLGLSLEVEVDIHDTNGSVIPAPKPPGSLYETDLFNCQIEGSEEIIREIIRANVSSEFLEKNHLSVD